MHHLNFVKIIFVFLAITVMVGCGDDKTPAVNLAPEFEEETYTFEIAENASSGDALGAVSATDENASDILAYSITTTQTDFAMNASTGEVALAADAVLDYEAVVSYTLQVQVSDGATPALTATATVTINVGDVNEFNPEFAQASYSFSLAADAAVGDEVGKIAATDSDGTAQLTYTLSGKEAANFAITDGTNVASGEEVSVVVAADVDLTSLVSPVKITVTVSDGENPVDTEVEITIAPVGTNAVPIFANTSYSFNVASDATDGAVVGTVSATDEDEGDILAYSLSGTEAGSFAISNTPVASGEEVSITVATNADLPALVSPVALTVEVSDGTDQVTANVEITIVAGNVAPVFDQTAYTFNVAEGAVSGAILGNVSATDSNAGDRLTYSLSGEGAGNFAIMDGTNAASGEEVSVTVATNADLPALVSPVALTVEVSDGIDQVTANVEITIVAGNVAPVFDQTAYTFNVAEDAVSGAILGPVSATDSNDGDRLTYSLSGTDADHFAISNTPVTSGTAVPVTVAASADLSSLTSPVTLIVTVTDDETPALMATANVEITIIAGNVAPVFVQTDYTFTIAEGAADGAIVGNVSATDFNAGDLLAYTISGTDAGSFAISNAAVASDTDVPITVAASANLPSLSSPVTLTVTVTDNATPALMATANVEITIIEGNVAPVFDQTAYTFAVNEDATSGKELGPVSATDSNTGNLLTYILSGTGADNFAIDHTAVASGTDVQITVSSTASLDHETVDSYTLEVQASDDASPALTATAEVTINVGDVNEHDPVFSGTPYTFSVEENAPASTVVDVVAATDADGTATIAYSIVTATTDFDIDAGTGEITVGTSAALDFETADSHILEVEASDGTNTATAEVTINVNNVNDNDPVFTGAPYTFSVDENSSASTLVGMVSATDADAGTTLEYSIVGTQTNFEMDANTGEVKVGTSAALDFETTTSYTLEVEASDGTKTAMADVTINVDNVNEAPVFTGAPYTFDLDENSPVDTAVGMVAATDADAGTTLEYSIVGTQTDFGIDSGTGEIKVASATLNHEVLPSYTLDVEVSDGASPPLTATAAVTINVGDVNDAPAFPQTSYDFTVVMGAPVGRVVTGTALAATDEDAGDMANLTYSLVATNANFEVAADGTISVKSGATLGNVAATHTFMVQVQDDGTPPLTATAPATVTVTITARIDYDLDDDRLIDINNLEQLNAMRWDLDGDGVPAAANTADYMAAYPDAVAFPTEDDTKPIGYELMRNLDFDEDDSYAGVEADQTWSEAQGTTSGGWDPIGGFTSETSNTPYTATFDGNGNTISNLYITRSDAGSSGTGIGLFAALNANAVSDVGLVGMDITGRSYIGGLVGFSNAGTITGCHATGSATATTTGVTIMGGLIGHSQDGDITACYAEVTVTGGANLGGLIGECVGSGVVVTRCHATGNVTGTVGTSHAGGLIGVGSIKVVACYATGTVMGGDAIGGLIGIQSTFSDSTVACYATGNVTSAGGGASGLFIAGGLIGWVDSSPHNIIACYATGDVTGRTSGGLVGAFGVLPSDGNSATACYATGMVAGTSSPGGLFGSSSSGNTITASYYDSGTTGQVDTGKGTPQTTTELQTPTAYGTMTSDIYSTWNADIDNGLTQGIDDATAAGDATADDPWDFGTASQYPALKVDYNGDGSASVAEFGTQPRG